VGRIIQTKQSSRASGGPQYHLHDLDVSAKTLLRKLGKCEVWLGTPYGLVVSGLTAVAQDKVLTGNTLRPGKVGHDRLQRTTAAASVEGAIIHWFRIKAKSPIKRVDFREACYKSRVTGSYALIIMPERITFQNGREEALPFERNPLTLTHNHRSNLLLQQINTVAPQKRRWAKTQIERVISDHLGRKLSYLGEEDLLRTSGALYKLGIRLGAYRRKGYDCFDTEFQFLQLPPYRCPVEVKKNSSNFDYQILKKTKPERAVVLCLRHKPTYSPPDVVDIIELDALYQIL